jgi:copper oxidase (laccase) domain-containing protein
MIFTDWPAKACVKAVTTTRNTGVSKGPYESLNLADHVGDAADAVRQNRLSIQHQLNLPGRPVWLNQIHGNTVVDAANSGERLMPAGGAWPMAFWRALCGHSIQSQGD